MRQPGDCTTGRRAAARPLAAIVARLAPNEVQINTPLRPYAVAPLHPEALAAVREDFRGLHSVHTVYDAVRPEVVPFDTGETLRRRPVADRTEPMMSPSRKG